MYILHALGFVSDFGLDHLAEITGETNFPWLMSNVRDRHTGRLLADGEESLIIEWEGRKVCTPTRTSHNVSRPVRWNLTFNLANRRTLTLITVVLFAGIW